MEIYGRVATSTAELSAVEDELSAARGFNMAELVS